MGLFGKGVTERTKAWVGDIKASFHAGGISHYEGGAPVQRAAATYTVNGVPPHINAIWSYWDAVGDFHAGGKFFAACLSRCTLRLGVRDVDNNIGPAFDEDGKPLKGVPVRLANLGARLIASIGTAPGMVTTEGPVGGHSMILGNIGKHLYSTSVCWLVAKRTPTGDNWEVLSTAELVPMPKEKPEDKQQFKRRRHFGGQWEEWTPDFYLRIFDPHPAACVDEATEILTSTGWRSHSELQVGDEVLTLNHDTGMSEWQPVQKVHRYQVENEIMRSMGTTTHSSLTTMNHRWPVVRLHSGNRVWKDSASLCTTDLIPLGAPHADVPAEPKWSDAFVELVAWYWTEGSQREPVIYQSATANPHHVESIQAALTTLFGPPSDKDMRHCRPRSGNCRFDECGWPAILKGLCAAHNEQKKRGLTLRAVRRRTAAPAPFERPSPAWRMVPKGKMMTFRLNEAAAEELLIVAPKRQVSLDFIRQLTRSQLELFIRKSVDADGTTTPEGYTTITQKNPNMLVPFELACVLAGYVPRRKRITSKGGPGTPGGRDAYSGEGWSVSVGRGTRFHVADQLGEQIYTGTVWCPQTENGSWMARRNGNPFFTGNSGDPDSSAVPLLSVLERLALLDAEGLADSKSRLKGPGILWVPSEMDFPSTNDDPEGEKYLQRELIETASIGIKDPSSASRHVPLVVSASGDRIPQVVHQKFDYDGNQLIEKRGAATGDLARGTPLPYEAVTGYGDTSMANAFAIDEQLVRIYAMPALDLITGFLTGGWFTNALMLATGQSLTEPPSEDIRRLCVWYDVAGLVNAPDPAKLAQWAYGTDTNPNGLISAKGARRLVGIPEGEAPSDEEVERRIAHAQKLRARSEKGGDEARPDDSDDDPMPEDRQDGERDKDEEVGKRVMSVAGTVVELAVAQAGNKLRSKVAKRPELLARIDGVDAADVARVLGPAVIESLGGTGPLLNGTFVAFERTVLREFVDAGRADAADLATAATNMAKRATLARLSNPAARLDAKTAHEFLELLLTGDKP